jgi:hypothetical protein
MIIRIGNFIGNHLKGGLGMKIAVISYSLTGNNEALAKRVAKELEVEHFILEESKHRTNGTIIMDMVFNRTPQVQPLAEKFRDYDLILLFGPVWMGCVASPLRSYLTYLRNNPHKYSYNSISGGALNPNPKLAGELNKRVGYDPISLTDLHIVDLLPANPKPTSKDTSNYHITDEDIAKLAEKVVEDVRAAIAKNA